MWHRDSVQRLFEKARDRINSGVSRDLTCRLEHEIPPNDTRHLTDTRTRVSTLLEYSLAFEAGEVLKKEYDNHWLSFVLWNVFPDLLLRGSDGKVVAGIEVKALHTAAEEKSANLSTPISKIRSGGDFIVIMNWSWQRFTKSRAAARFPRIHSIDTFNAHALARIRDFTWLKNQGSRIKGIDCSTPILSSQNTEGLFKAEEGNLGKLMRIRLDQELPDDFPEKDALIKENGRFVEFQDQVIALGLTSVFDDVCFGIGASDVDTKKLTTYPNKPTLLGQAKLPSSKSLHLWAGNGIPGKLKEVSGEKGDFVLSLGRKLDWALYIHDGNKWKKVSDGKKAENSIALIDQKISRGDQSD